MRADVGARRDQRRERRDQRDVGGGGAAPLLGRRRSRCRWSQPWSCSFLLVIGHLNGGQVNGVQVRVRTRSEVNGDRASNGKGCDMRYRRADVVEQALGVLDTYGLADLTMRRLGSELGVQPSALYHHFANKQPLLAAVADEILARGRARSAPGRLGRAGRGDLHRAARRDARLPRRRRAGRDGVLLRARRHHAVRRPGRRAGRRRPRPGAGAGGGADPAALRLRSRRPTSRPTSRPAAPAPSRTVPATESDFAAGLGIVLDGIRVSVTRR